MNEEDFNKHFSCNNCGYALTKKFINGKICIARVRNPIRNDIFRVCFKRNRKTLTAGLCENCKDINIDEAKITISFLNSLLEMESQKLMKSI